MANEQTSTAERKTPRKREVRKEVYAKLADALAGYKTELGDKKFENRLKKASKLFAFDLVKAGRKNNGKSKNGKNKHKATAQ